MCFFKRKKKNEINEHQILKFDYRYRVDLIIKPLVRKYLLKFLLRLVYLINLFSLTYNLLFNEKFYWGQDKSEFHSKTENRSSDIRAECFPNKCTVCMRMRTPFHKETFTEMTCLIYFKFNLY